MKDERGKFDSAVDREISKQPTKMRSASGLARTHGALTPDGAGPGRGRPRPPYAVSPGSSGGLGRSE